MEKRSVAELRLGFKLVKIKEPVKNYFFGMSNLNLIPSATVKRLLKNQAIFESYHSADLDIEDIECVISDRARDEFQSYHNENRRIWKIKPYIFGIDTGKLDLLPRQNLTEIPDGLNGIFRTLFLYGYEARPCATVRVYDNSPGFQEKTGTVKNMIEYWRSQSNYELELVDLTGQKLTT